MTEAGIDTERELLRALREQHGVKVTQPDIQSFIERARPMRDALAKDMKAEDILAMIRRASAL
jgi:TRAP-type C4-dicarboxylate transport system substrate-binding protein